MIAAVSWLALLTNHVRQGLAHRGTRYAEEAGVGHIEIDDDEHDARDRSDPYGEHGRGQAPARDLQPEAQEDQRQP